MPYVNRLFFIIWIYFSYSELYSELSLLISNSLCCCFCLYFMPVFSQVSGNLWLSNILKMKQHKTDWKLLVYGKNFSVAGGSLIWKIFHEIVDDVWFSKSVDSFSLGNWPRKFLWENSPISCLKERESCQYPESKIRKGLWVLSIGL